MIRQIEILEFYSEGEKTNVLGMDLGSSSLLGSSTRYF